MEEIKKILSEIISKDGVKVSGNGIIIKKLEAIEKLTDKTNRNLFFVEDKLKKIIELIERKI